MSSPPVEYDGPYEHWGFGPGAPYDRTRTRGERDRFVAVVADSATVLAQSRRQADSDGAVRFLPMVTWRTAHDDQAVSMIPVLMDSAAHGSPADATDATTGVTSVRFRRSARIGTATVNPKFKAGRIDRRLAAGRRMAKPRVLMAVIDDGIPFAHGNFVDGQSRSRIEFCWLQGATTVSEVERQTVPFGRELVGGDIDAMRDGGLDEDVLYQHFSAMEDGLPAPSSIARAVSHGAHVMDLAAGHRHGSRLRCRPVGRDGTLDDVGIIAVQLPASALLDTAGFGKDALVLGALHYIFDRADRLAALVTGDGRPLPLVINFSFGFTGGPHDGRDRLERAVRDLVVQRRRSGGVTELVMPSGNSFRGALHGQLQPHAAGECSLRWRVQPNDHTPNFLELWLPRGERFEGHSLILKAPHGEVAVRLDLADPGDQPVHEAILAGNGDQVGQLSLENYDLGDGERQGRIVLILAPTEPDDPLLPAPISGAWMVSIATSGERTVAGPITCRIQRDEAPFAYIQGARQSYIDDPNDAPFAQTGALAFEENDTNSIVRRFGTINGMATHDAVIVVGGFRANSGLPSPYSAAGPLDGSAALQGNVKVSASSDTSSALGGIAAAGTRSGSVRRLDGTSVASPQVARVLALSLCEDARPNQAGPVPSRAMDLLADHLMAPQEAGIIDRPGWVAHVEARLGRGLLRSSLSA